MLHLIPKNGQAALVVVLLGLHNCQSWQDHPLRAPLPKSKAPKKGRFRKQRTQSWLFQKRPQEAQRGSKGEKPNQNLVDQSCKRGGLGFGRTKRIRRKKKGGIYFGVSRLWVVGVEKEVLKVFVGGEGICHPIMKIGFWIGQLI